jgi:hypothetical protein
MKHHGGKSWAAPKIDQPDAPVQAADLNRWLGRNVQADVTGPLTVGQFARIVYGALKPA